jgi:acyl-CoA synthetase (AMP-forming)/AMP-acid ligase II
MHHHLGASAGGWCSEKLVDGWLLMGDMASMNPEEFLFLEGRPADFPHIGGAWVAHPAACRKLAESENMPS